MHPRDLIATARRLVGNGTGKPRQSDLKRAMSTAYYAMFHALCRNCVDSLIGKTPASRSQPAWNQAYRAVEHRYTKSQCRKKEVMCKFPDEIQRFAVKLGELQDHRHQADYDPLSGFTRDDVQAAIDAAETAVQDLQSSSIKDRKAFAAWTVMKTRNPYSDGPALSANEERN